MQCARDASFELGEESKEKEMLDDEIKFLDLYQGCDYVWMAKELNRSLHSVEHKIERLGLQKYNKWQVKDKTIIPDKSQF